MWVKVDDRFFDHPKLWAATSAAGIATGPARIAGVWLCGLCHANCHRTAGELRHADLYSWRRFDRQVQRIAGALTASGLWEPIPHGYRIHDYADYQPRSFPQEISTGPEFSTGNTLCSDQDPRKIPKFTVPGKIKIPAVHQVHQVHRTALPVENRNVLRALIWAELARMQRRGTFAVTELVAEIDRIAQASGLVIADRAWMDAEIAIAIRQGGIRR